MFRQSVSLSAEPSPPEDALLPGGNLLVDSAFLREHLLSIAHTSSETHTVQIDVVRYKPGVRLVVAASLIDPDEEVAARGVFHAFRKGESAASVAKMRTHGVPETAIARDADLEWTAVAFPYDYELPGLQALSADREGATYLRRLLPAYAAPTTRLRSKSLNVRLLRLKPGRHAVFRLDATIRNELTREKTPMRWLARVLPPAAPPPGSPRSWGNVTPRRLAWDAHRGVSIEEWVDGVNLTDVDQPDWDEVASSIHAFHIDLPTDFDSDRSSILRRDTDRVRSTIDVIRSHSLPASNRVQELADRALRASHVAATRSAPVRVHGDLHGGQILVSPKRVSIVDVTTSHVAPAEHDLADLLLSVSAEGSRPTPAAAAFLGAYRTLRPGVSDDLIRARAALRALDRAAAPVRNLHPDRARLVDEWLDRADRLLSVGHLETSLAFENP